MTNSDFISRITRDSMPESGTAGWMAPSNIALVKYWGKRPGQIPANPSLSFTLNASCTRTELRYRFHNETTGPGVTVFLDGTPAPDFKPKVLQFLERALPYMPFLGQVDLEVHTSNSFPHSSGIASSASGMAALALCLMALERKADPGMDDAFFLRKASFLARLGSGSASRSIEGGLIFWGEHNGVPGSSDLFAIPYPFETHTVFDSFCDTILLVDKGKKSVSSTAGHGLMEGHPFAESRFQQARNNIDTLRSILREGDLHAFADLVETEALSLHAMMMSGSPSYLLMKPGTLSVIEEIREYRRETGLPVCFTLDAGANVHVLYPKVSSEQVYSFIKDRLLRYCVEGHHTCDQVGKGARPLSPGVRSTAVL